jgi:hypothetical protein
MLVTNTRLCHPERATSIVLRMEVGRRQRTGRRAMTHGYCFQGLTSPVVEVLALWGP